MVISVCVLYKERHRSQTGDDKNRLEDVEVCKQRYADRNIRIEIEYNEKNCVA